MTKRTQEYTFQATRYLDQSIVHVYRGIFHLRFYRVKTTDPAIAITTIERFVASQGLQS